MRRLTIAAAALTLCGLGSLRHVQAGAGDVEEAAKLRDQSAVDWNAGRYREAAEKLRRAEAIYARAPEKFVADLGTVRRALVWNLVKAGDPSGARDPFALLLGVYGTDPSVRSDVWNAYQALYEAAKAASDVAGAQAVLDPVREAALVSHTPDVASQVLHDLGSISRQQGDSARAASYYESAIEERRAAGDHLGEAWSLNNLANLNVGGDRWRSSLIPLLAAHQIVVGEGIAPPAFAVATNVRTALAKIDSETALDATLVAWLGDIARAGVGVDGPVVIPTDSLLRRALRASVGAAKDAPARLAAARAALADSKALVGVPPETRADLVLTASKIAGENGLAKDALAWLSGLEVGGGPSSPHLAVRTNIERARSASAGGASAKELGDWIAAARKGLTELRDRPLRLEALAVLGTAAKAARLDALASQIADEAAKASREGAEGGRGGMARGGGNVARFRALGPADVVFEIRFADGKISIRDTLVDDEPVSVEVVWLPVNVAVDGLSLTVFGGYVVVRSLDYGGSAVAPGASPNAALDAFPARLPVPATGALRVHANGATSYGK